MKNYQVPIIQQLAENDLNGSEQKSRHSREKKSYCGPDF
jgi:hypothetical protein